MSHLLVNASPVVPDSAVPAVVALEHFTVANNFDPVVTGLAHSQPNATAITIDKSKAWEAFGTGNNDWVPTTDRAGSALVNKGDMAVGGGGGTGLKVMAAGADGAFRVSDSTTIYGFRDTKHIAPTAASVKLTGEDTTITNLALAYGCSFVDSHGRYLATGGVGLGVIDCLNTNSPVVLSNTAISTVGTCRRLRWSGDVIWYLGGSGSLQLINAKKPKAPVAFTGGTSGVVALSGTVYGMDVFGNYAVVVSANGAGNNFFVVDGSNPSSPVVIGTLALGSYTQFDARVFGNLAVVAQIDRTASGETYAGAIQLVDISTLTAPATIVGGAGGVIGVPQGGRGISIANGVAYVATYSSGGASLQKVYAISLADPATPVRLGSVSIGTGGEPGTLVGTKVFTPSYTENCVYVTDFSDPAAPVLVRTYAALANPSDATSGPGYVAVASAGQGICSIIAIGEKLTADMSSLGNASARRLTVERNVDVAGSMTVDGVVEAKALRLSTPPVLATGAGHTVDELIALLQVQGLMKQA